MTADYMPQPMDSPTATRTDNLEPPMGMYAMRGLAPLGSVQEAEEALSIRAPDVLAKFVVARRNLESALSEIFAAAARETSVPEPSWQCRWKMRTVQIRYILGAVTVLGLLTAGGGRAHAGATQLGAGTGTLAGAGRCPSSSAGAINRWGDIVGSCVINDNISYGVLLRGGRYTFIDVPHSKSTDPSGINSEGSIVGVYTDEKGKDRSFLLHSGHYTTLNDPLGSDGTYASDINDAGEVVGWYDNTSTTMHGFLLHGGRYTTLFDPREDPQGIGTTAIAINDRGDVVGTWSDSNAIIHGFVLRKGRYATIDGPLGTEEIDPSGINDRGEVVGWYYGKRDAKSVAHAFLLRGGRLSRIDVPHSRSTLAFGVNVQGDIVGAYTDSRGQTRGFLLHAGHFTTIDFPKPGS